MSKILSDCHKNCLKIQILLIGNKIRNAYYGAYSYNYVIDEEIQTLMDYYELISYKNFIIYKSNKLLLELHDLNSINHRENSINIGKILGYVNYTHLYEKCIRLGNNKSSNTINEVIFSIECDNYHIFCEIALIDYDNFNMDDMIKHMEELEEKYINILHHYGYKNVQYHLSYYEKTYNDNEFYRTNVNKVNIEKRKIIEFVSCL